MTVSDGADLDFYFDPVCPFAWMTSKWVRMVAQQRDYSVDWRFMSLRIINADVDYDAHFPPGYEDGHTAGLRLLRVAARVRAEHGRAAVGPLYSAIGTRIFDTAIDREAMIGSDVGGRAFLEPILRQVGLAPDLADALDDASLDVELRVETEEALSLTGKDVGTPILQFRPPTGTAFFGPVISRLPSPEDAGRLWDHVLGLASFPGFAELKRSLREQPQLASFGVDIDSVGIQEDWHGGSRRTKEQRGHA
ncbi:mycothiol-dependent nitroreductase Rv2466c family protein [Mycobacterium sp.]|uniref:mycothiol-dependent nitroreductase Rv2466c family protein n=1 Tax=Mycobacterium sp. TaxID=1785 RepID=UPI003F944D78